MSVPTILFGEGARPAITRWERRIATVLFGLAALFALAVCAPVAHADDGAEGIAADGAAVVNLEPDGYYNASLAATQTLVRISEPGTYAILGSSSLVRVVVAPDPGDEIRVYLGNGLNLHPKSNAAITVVSAYTSTSQSHVELMLLQGAKASLSSGDTSAVLLLEEPSTVTPPSSEPMVTIGAQDARGTLTLKAGSKAGSAGSPALAVDGAGAADIAGGTVTATGAGDAPGIGRVYGGPKLSVSGGTVTATSGGNAPGIGVVSGSAQVSVSGGTVHAKGGKGAPGIGGIEGSASVSITGGAVYPSNGSIDDAPLIGSVEGDASISIAGGKTVATGEYGQLALGSKAGNAQVSIAGGTVDVGFAACGSGPDGTAKTMIYGGSYTGFTTGTGASASTAINRAGVTTYRVFAGLEGAKAGIGLQSLEIHGVNPPYAFNDVETSLIQVREGVQEAGVMLWLPEAGEVVGAIDGEGVSYTGEIHPTKPSSGLDYGMLERGCNLTLDPNTDAGYEGEAAVRYGSSEVIVEEEVEPNEDNLILLGFYDEPEGGTMVMDAQYRLVPGADGWTSGWGAWDRYDAPYILYAQWRVVPYAIAYDANVPVAASTSMTGSMELHYADCGEETALQPLGYALPGYRFMEWNTEPDGTGDSYEDGEQVVDLAESGNLITLYAQWEPQSYEVTFAPGEGPGEEYDRTYLFDQSSALDALEFEGPAGSEFSGWLDEETGALYADQAQVVNLCTAEEDGTPKGHRLVAQWTRNDVTLIITHDNEPVQMTDSRNDIKLIPEGGGEPVTGFEQDAAGAYVLADVAPGTYGIDIDATDDEGNYLYPTAGLSIAVEVGQPSVLPIEYCTVAVEADDPGIGAWIGSAGIGSRVVLKGSEVTLGATADEEYGKFDRWRCRGVKPTGWDYMQAVQTVTVEGPFTAIACVRPTTYLVNFDANGGKGTMNPQRLTVDDIGVLNPNAFTREGYAFAGWNTRQDGEGVPLKDEARVAGLTLPGGEITLYAQWTPVRYKVSFDANVPASASTTVSGEMNAQAFVYDVPAALPSCSYVLPGYKFVGWNTEPDGSGVMYADGAEVLNLAADSSSIIELYAQWEAASYSVSLDVEGVLTELEAVFDVPFELPDTVDAPDGKTLIGWEGLSFGSLYAGGTTVVNLCTVHEDGSVSGDALRAILVEDGAFSLVITNNGVGVSLPDASDIVLQDASGTQYKPFKAAGSGLYVAQGMQPGEYSVLIEGWNTEGAFAQVAPDGSGSLALEYFSAQIDAENHAVAWAEDPASGERGQFVERLRTGDELRIGASVDEGYSFESWTAIGAEPTWENGDPTAAEQTVIVSGRALLEAHPVANRYKVLFDANGGEGSMEPQDMVYDEPQALFANAFEREGYEFIGWSTDPEGGDAVYSDRERVSNLTAEPNGEVTLYAQWDDTSEPGLGTDPDDPDDSDEPGTGPDGSVNPNDPDVGSDAADDPNAPGGSGGNAHSDERPGASESGGDSAKLAATSDGSLCVVVPLAVVAAMAATVMVCAGRVHVFGRASHRLPERMDK